MIDLDDAVPLSVTTTDAAGVAASPTTIVLTVTLPDGTSVTPTVTTSPTGTHTATYTTTQEGLHRVAWVATGVNMGAYRDTFNVELFRGIVSMDDAKAHLNITSTTNDDELRRIVNAATDFFERHLGTIVRRTIVEKVTPSSDGALYLSAPLLSLTTITDTYGYGTTYTVGDYTADSRVLYPRAFIASYPYTVTVTYVGGWTVVPGDLRTAVLDYIAWKWETQRGAASPSALLPGGDFAAGPPATVPLQIREVIDGYAQRHAGVA